MMRYLWLDLETTGLDPRTEQILEVAVVATGRGPHFPQGSPALTSILVTPESWKLDGMNDYVRQMHTANGLLLELQNAFHYFPSTVERQLLTYITQWEWEMDGLPILAGSSPHFDRGFLDVHMPRFSAALHHRHFDVSTLKMAHMDMGHPKFPKAEAHRAWPDILESMAHATHIYSSIQGPQ
jgi:oligoribonuclease